MKSIPWDGEVGGYGFTEWKAPPEDWLPGTYEVQIFVGLDWKVVGEFILQGDSPTPIPTQSPTPTPLPTVPTLKHRFRTKGRLVPRAERSHPVFGWRRRSVS